jgi:hypothetical protein
MAIAGKCSCISGVPAVHGYKKKPGIAPGFWSCRAFAQ